ncbi:MAG: AbrB/MazE/SpoVT family DNA-binding domain-containing protein [Pseudomonadota bacterium]
MSTATLTSKGQITLPIEVRRALNLTPGDKVDFVSTGDGFLLVLRDRDIRSLRGRFRGRVDEPVSLDEMDEAIADAVSELE